MLQSDHYGQVTAPTVTANNCFTVLAYIYVIPIVKGYVITMLNTPIINAVTHKLTTYNLSKSYL